MLLIGLTGGIASGKSFVSNCFEKHGAPVIDADQLAREVVEPGSQGLQALTDHFSSKLLTPDGDLDRAELRRIVFANPEERKFLDNTLHPLIRALSEQRITEASGANHAYLVYAVPLLVETKQEKRFDRIAVVDVPVAVQLERLMNRDGGNEEQARSILASQATREQRLAVADDVIENSGEMSATQERVAELHNLYLQLHTRT